MKILIDADACPVTNIAVNTSNKYNIECLLFCDTSHYIKIYGAQTIIVDKGSDSVDFALVNKADENDIVITQDYGLASMCLAKKAYVLNQNGLEYTKDNIAQLMETRYEAKRLRNSGVRLKGIKPRTHSQNINFEKKLVTLIEKIQSI